MTPLVSIVLPFRNSARYLPECMESIRSQTLEDFEVVAVDDGSDDDSARCFSGIAARDPRFRLIQPGAIGLVGALNLAIEQARSGLIARMDADDVMLPGRLQMQADLLAHHPRVAVASCLVEIFAESELKAGYREYLRWLNACITPEDISNNLFVESPVAHPSVMFRRIVVASAGGYRPGDFPEDYELWLRLHAGGYLMAKVPEVLLRWREHTGRLSRNDMRYSREAFDRLRAMYLSMELRARAPQEIVVWGAGRPTRKRARLLPASLPISAWIDIDPRKIGKTYEGRPVHPPEWLERSPHPFVLIYVTNHGAREEIAGRLEHLGYRCGSDYLAVG